ncbi:MAG TPA: hypothetical protein VL947_13620 [Cytophagales bacterium]|nr:hypothetical protein [Cytophagales bacterium]
MYKIILNIVLLLSVVDHVVWAKENKDAPLTSSDPNQEEVYHAVLEKKNMGYATLLLGSESGLSKQQRQSIEKRIDKICDLMKDKRRLYSSETRFVQYVFYHLKSNYLVNYKADAQFSELLTGSTYDCVTGTALLALVFDRLGMKYQILETYSHVCIKIQSDSTHMLLEPTLKDGVYANGKQIYERLKKMQSEKKEQVLKVLSSSYKSVDVNYYCTKINLLQLIGILYFNNAAQGLSEKKYESSIYYAKIANMLYPSVRTQGFLVYSMDNLLKDDSVDFKSKMTYYKKYKYLIDESLSVLK